jgi:hypothetical protein
MYNGRTLFKRRELEPAYQAEELLVRGWFAELPVGAGGVELPGSLRLHEYDGKWETGTHAICALEPDGFDDGICHLFDAHFFIFADCCDGRGSCRSAAGQMMERMKM